MSFSKVHDIGAYLKGFNAFNPIEVTAATTTEDGIEINGKIIDRRVDGASVSNVFLSGKVIIAYDGALTTGKTLTVASNVQHSDTTASTAFADLADRDGSTGVSVVETNSTGGNGTPSGVLEFDLRLDSAKRYLRIQVTPTLSATATDTVDMGGVTVLGMGDFIPAQASSLV